MTTQWRWAALAAAIVFSGCSCGAKYTIGGTLDGNTGPVVLQNNGGDELTVTKAGAFAFATPLDNGKSYAVKVKSAPQGQTCAVAHGSGKVLSANVTTVTVTCTTSSSAYTVGGTVTGLNGTIVLRNNGGDDLFIARDGPFNFGTPLANHAAYDVTVRTQPKGMTQLCTVTNGQGTISSATVTSVQITCASSTYTVGGAVGGLSGTVVLRNDGTDDLALTTDGPFTFATPLPQGAAYRVTVASQPVGQLCVVSAASGTISGADVTSVAVTCVPLSQTRTIGGTMSGLTGTVVLQDNGADDLRLTADGPFTFATTVPDSFGYAVTVKSQPAGQSCTVSGGAGLVQGADITTVQVACADLGPTFTVSGLATYDWVPALDDVTEGGVRLGYSQKTARALRRAVVQAIDVATGSPVDEQLTRDDGSFTLTVPTGTTAKVRVQAHSLATQWNGGGACTGASWDFQVVDNTNGGALYVMDSSSTFSQPATGIALNAALGFTQGTGYTERTAAPFAILDTVLTEMALFCSAEAGLTFSPLTVNWSINNTDSGGNISTGMIGTSYFSDTGGLNLYILGKANVDTDEYDDHVIAHECGHFMEHDVYRSDSIGGNHVFGDSLDPRLAFSEGFGNSVSAMTFADPVYVDTSGAFQGSGFSIDNSAAPAGDDRGVYSETSAQYFLYSLFTARGSFDRIHDVLRNHQKTTPAFTSLQTFAAFYNQLYGFAAEGLQTLWSGAANLDTPYNSLCAGNCNGSGDTADPYDSDNDVGAWYAAKARSYPEGNSTAQPAEFWKLYEPLSSGTHSATAHDQTNTGGYFSASNKLGMNRWYRYAGTGALTTVTVGNLGGGNACTDDVDDLFVWHAGTLVTKDESAGGGTAGCPTVTFNTTNGDVYLIVVQGFYNGVPSFDLTVSP